MAFFNPFCSQEAISNSNYCILQKANYTTSKPIRGRLKSATDKVANELAAFVKDIPELQLQAGKEALVKNTRTTEEPVQRKKCTFGVYQHLGSPNATAGLSRDLASFLHELKEGRSKINTFMAVFTTPSSLSYEDFLQKVEAQLSLLKKAAEPFYCVPESEAAALKKGSHMIAFGGRVLKVNSIYRNTSGGGQLKFNYPMLTFSVLS